jgi:DNA-binding transcriptional ArsR family regulator
LILLGITDKVVMTDKGHIKDDSTPKAPATSAHMDTFVLDKSIFSNIFDKDIKRVYIYKKAERLAKAIHLIGPAFAQSTALRERLDKVAVGLVDAAILPPMGAREALSRELLALSSVLSIARVGNLLSTMNSDMIVREAHQLLQEIAMYEEPRLSLEEAPTLAELAREATSLRRVSPELTEARITLRTDPVLKGHVKDITPRSTTGTRQNAPAAGAGADNGKQTDRREAILSILRSKGPSYIKDISTVIRDVSEKTIQRELGALIAAGSVEKSGERRWTTYTLVG